VRYGRLLRAPSFAAAAHKSRARPGIGANVAISASCAHRAAPPYRDPAGVIAFNSRTGATGRSQQLASRLRRLGASDIVQAWACSRAGFNVTGLDLPERIFSAP
jgi:hypothetical protein